jgi:hypothetical protein
MYALHTIVGDPHVHMDRNKRGDKQVALTEGDVADFCAARELQFVGVTSHRHLPLQDLLDVRARLAGTRIECFANREVTVQHRGARMHVAVLHAGSDIFLPNTCSLDELRELKRWRPDWTTIAYHPGLGADGMVIDRGTAAEICADPCIDGLEIANEEVLRTLRWQLWEHQLRIYEDVLMAGRHPLTFGGSDMNRGEDVQRKGAVLTQVLTEPDGDLYEALIRPGAARPLIRLHPDIAGKVDRVRAAIGADFDRWMAVE